jgi:hypothetical protein
MQNEAVKDAKNSNSYGHGATIDVDSGDAGMFSSS